jgi:hypothetical protein
LGLLSYLNKGDYMREARGIVSVSLNKGKDGFILGHGSRVELSASTSTAQNTAVFKGVLLRSALQRGFRALFPWAHKHCDICAIVYPETLYLELCIWVSG